MSLHNEKKAKERRYEGKKGLFRVGTNGKMAENQLVIKSEPLDEVPEEEEDSIWASWAKMHLRRRLSRSKKFRRHTFPDERNPLN